MQDQENESGDGQTTAGYDPRCVTDCPPQTRRLTYHTVTGILKPHVRWNINYTTGDTLSITRVTDIEVDRTDRSATRLRP